MSLLDLLVDVAVSQEGQGKRFFYSVASDWLHIVWQSAEWVSHTALPNRRRMGLSGNGGCSMATDTSISLTDAELVARAQLGDRDALHDLLAELRPALVRFCHFRLSGYAGGRDAADDAVQETCLAVAHVLAGYQDKGLPFRAWVYAIAANKVADAQRRFGRGDVLVDELPEQVEPAPTPEEAAIVAAEYRAAMALIDQLPARMRDVLLLRASGATAKRVGETLQMSAGAVNVAHHRAVARLRQLADDSEELRELFGPLRASDGAALPQVA